MERSLGSVLKSALVAGVLAGLLVAAYHFIVTEPVLQHAIDAEEAVAPAASGAAADHHEEEEELVSRPTQRFGLFVGFFFYGVAWSLIAAAIYYPAQRWLPFETVAGKTLLLAFLLYWAVALLPFLRYPANPPGVGDPETIAHRQTLYIGFLAISILGTALALLLGELAARGKLSSALQSYRFAVIGAVMVAVGAVLYLAMPPFTDPINIPDSIVNDFRWRSLLGLTLFWALFGLGFAALLRRPERDLSVARAQPDPA
jgi:predicted cobalt transporter CbtA